MCSLLGVRQAFSHAYHHQGNGKVERTGRELKDWLGRATDGGRISWLSVLGRVRQLYHDTPGITGYSPQVLVFGRERHLAGAPYGGSLGVEAESWFAGVRSRDEEVKGLLEEVQRKRVARWNRARREPVVYLPGEWVWYRHPVDRSSELHASWVGPYVVRVRTSVQSYVLWTSKRELEAPVSLMKRWLGPVYGAALVPLGYEKLSKGPSFVLPGFLGVVDRIEAHRDGPQGVEFCTHRRGTLETSWEPVGQFFYEFSSVLVRYANEHGLGTIPVIALLGGDVDRDLGSSWPAEEVRF